ELDDLTGRFGPDAGVVFHQPIARDLQPAHPPAIVAEYVNLRDTEANVEPALLARRGLLRETLDDVDLRLQRRTTSGQLLGARGIERALVGVDDDIRVL